MPIINTYWKHVATKIAKEHPEQKTPSEWTKSEAQSYLSKLQKKTNKTISPTTFRRIFKDGHLGKMETRDIFAQYFNYPNHGDYIKAELKKKSPKKWIYFAIAGILSLGAFFLIPLPLQKVTSANASIEESDFKKIIQKSINYQFAAFKAIPNYEAYLDSMQLVYHSDGSAYKDIIGILNRRKKSNWTISNQPNSSSAKLLSLKIDSVTNNQAFIATNEHWRLDWFNPNNQRYEYIYEATNEQKYVLSRTTPEGNWKILKNDYSSNKFRYISEYFSCEDIEEKVGAINRVKFEVRKAVENDGLDLALKIMECHFSNDNHPDFPNELSLLLAEKTKLLRAVNTDEMNQAQFENGKLALFQKILAYTDQL